MAIALNPDTNTQSSGIAGVRRKPSALLQPAKDKLLETKDQAKLDAIKAQLAVVDAGGAPAPSPTTAEIKGMIDDKLVTAIALQDSRVSASVSAAIASLDSKVSGHVADVVDSLDSKVSHALAALQDAISQLTGRVELLESSQAGIRDEIRTLNERLAGVGADYPGHEPNPGNKKQRS